MKKRLPGVGLVGGVLVLVVGMLWGQPLADRYLSSSAEMRPVWWIGTLAMLALILRLDRTLKRRRPV